jgi:hypothetical protein
MWIRLGAEALPPGALEKVVDAVDAPLEMAATAVDIGVQALELLQTLALGAEDLAAAALSAAVDALDHSIKELLECNVSTFLHMNVVWDPTWKYSELADHGRWPWTGTGVQGWALDVAASLHDTSDPLRPVTDADTEAWGLMFLVGVPGAEALGDITGAVAKCFTKYKPFLEMFNADQIKKYGADYAGLSRLGDAFLDPFIRDSVGSPNAIAAMKAEWARIGPRLTAADGYLPLAGNYPHWYAAPVTTIIPPIEGFFTGLQNVVSALRPPLGQLGLLDALAGAIRQKVQYLRYIVEKLKEAVEFIALLINFVSSAYVHVVKTDPGAGVGLDGAVMAAAVEPEAPDFGPGGIVLGIGIFATSGSMIAPLQSFWTTLGMQSSAFGEEVTARTQNIEDSYGSLIEDPP